MSSDDSCAFCTGFAATYRRFARKYGGVHIPSRTCIEERLYAIARFMQLSEPPQLNSQLEREELLRASGDAHSENARFGQKPVK